MAFPAQHRFLNFLLLSALFLTLFAVLFLPSRPKIKLETLATPKTLFFGTIEKIDPQNQILTLKFKDQNLEKNINVKVNESTKISAYYPPFFFSAPIDQSALEKSFTDFKEQQQISVSTKEDASKASTVTATFIEISNF